MWQICGLGWESSKDRNETDVKMARCNEVFSADQPHQNETKAAFQWQFLFPLSRTVVMSDIDLCMVHSSVTESNPYKPRTRPREAGWAVPDNGTEALCEISVLLCINVADQMRTRHYIQLLWQLQIFVQSGIWGDCLVLLGLVLSLTLLVCSVPQSLLTVTQKRSHQWGALRMK
jgi:hypothetical protein